MIDSELAAHAVRLFFVLSGYLLVGILLREQDEAARSHCHPRNLLRDFYVRRILRIWPAYYGALLLALLMGSEGVANTFAWHALFASNILFFAEQSWSPWVVAHLWTLSVEEQFYLVLPLVVLFLPRDRLRPLLIACIACAIAYRAVVGMTVGGTPDFYNLLPIASLDALGAGALLALIQHQRGRIAWKRLLAWSLPLAIVMDLLPLPEGFRFVVLAAYVPAMVAAVAGAESGIGGWAGTVLASRPIVALGRMSYGVYLYHLFVAAAFASGSKALGYPPLDLGPVKFIVLFCVTTAVAAASWFVLERPALSLKRHFRRVTTGVMPATPVRLEQEGSHGFGRAKGLGDGGWRQGADPLV